ncbi:MAG TPA: hypothetical protein EYP24_00855 [bacterium (Candidatus Stahlbacteria)]|nr:hypothetical protein [Candidatus Stahlbacteria bacterium]
MPAVLIFTALLVETHGRGFLAKYFPDDSIYNSDAVIEVKCDILKFGNIRFFIDFRNDLYMGKQPDKPVSLDPRNAHYYLTPGLSMDINDLILTGCIVHDCIHDIDIENPGTPVFNRFRFIIEPGGFNIRNRSRRVVDQPLWRLMLGSYPRFPSIYAWTNWGADYKYEMRLDLLTPIVKKNRSYLGLGLSSHVIRREERGFYQRHIIRGEWALYGSDGIFMPFISYTIYSDDPLRSPGQMGVFGIEVLY